MKFECYLIAQIIVYVSAKVDESLKDEKQRIKMGILNKNCDDGKTNLEVDWLDNPMNYTCYHPTTPLLPNFDRESVLECDDLPPDYLPQHYCMDEPISYQERIPTHGDHRPIWPKFGEYRFLPAQRWLHNVEHGAVIMLYHPCTHHFPVQELRSIVKGCIRKHIITPSTLVSEKQPLVLVAWGCRLSMSYVNRDEVIDFIKTRGKKGPEGDYPKEGQYSHELLNLAEAPNGSDMNDSVLCPGS